MLERIPNLDRFALLEQYRIQLVRRLKIFVSPEEAERISHEIMKIALAMDSLVQQIRSHPTFGNDYDYDGRVFTSRVGGGVSRGFDGLELLKNLNTKDVLRSYLTNGGIEHLMKVVEEERKLTEYRLEILREQGQIGFNREIVKEIETKEVNRFIEGMEREMGNRDEEN